MTFWEIDKIISAKIDMKLHGGYLHDITALSQLLTVSTFASFKKYLLEEAVEAIMYVN